ncbi:protein Red [Nephila pilipes]|uniref:Protein Red n=1 Tax=Nephila pilipes TaxID=299642 RepID=A0A8X6NWY9_NEPPI|nr:protein Red [Nephila pilipes]
MTSFGHKDGHDYKNNTIYTTQYSRTEDVRASSKITCYSCERKGHTADFVLLSFPKTRTESIAQSNTVNATEPSGTQDFSVLTAKISVPVEATTNVAELLTASVKIGHQKVYGLESPSDVLHVDSEEKKEDPSISTDSSVELSSTESGNENVTQRIRYRAEERRKGVNPNHQNEDAVKSAAGYHVIAPDFKSGSDAVERRCQRIHESKFLGGDMKNTHLVNGLDNALVQKVRNENYYKEKKEEKLESLLLKHKDKGEWKKKFNLKQNWEDTFIRKFSKIAIQSKESSFFQRKLAVHKGDDSILKAKLTSKLEKDMPESYAECYPSDPEEYSEYMKNKEAFPMAAFR